MANQNELDENFDEIQESDTTDWKSETIKLREKAIRQRERTKELRDSLREMQTKIADFEKSKPITEEPKTNEFGLLEKAFLRSAGYIDLEEIDLIKKWHQETKKSVDELIDHPFVKTEIENMRTAKANQAATSNVRGDSGISAAKDTPGYWLAKGELPEKTSQNRKLRANIARAMMAKSKEGSKFYNE